MDPIEGVTHRRISDEAASFEVTITAEGGGL